MIKRIMVEFKNRYDINIIIYEFCRCKNVRIPEKLVEENLDPTPHSHILERVIKEKTRKLDDFCKASGNEKAFPEILPKSHISTSYLMFRDNKKLSQHRIKTKCLFPQNKEEDEYEEL